MNTYRSTYEPPRSRFNAMAIMLFSLVTMMGTGAALAWFSLIALSGGF